MTGLRNAGFPGKQMGAGYNTNFRGKKKSALTEYGNTLNKVNLGNNCKIYSFGI